MAPVQLGSALPTWPNITALQNTSGVGTYETMVNMQPGSDLRILMDVGHVEGTWGVHINGQSVMGVDLFGNEPIDITKYAQEGSNSKSHDRSFQASANNPRHPDHGCDYAVE